MKKLLERMAEDLPGEYEAILAYHKELKKINPNRYLDLARIAVEISAIDMALIFRFLKPDFDESTEANRVEVRDEIKRIVLNELNNLSIYEIFCRYFRVPVEKNNLIPKKVRSRKRMSIKRAMMLAEEGRSAWMAQIPVIVSPDMLKPPEGVNTAAEDSGGEGFGFGETFSDGDVSDSDLEGFGF